MKLVFILSHKELEMANFCPTRDDICIWRGDTPVIFVTIRERNADGTQGDPIDVTGYSFRMTVDVSSEPSNSSNNLFSLTGSIVDASIGKVQFQPTEAQTDNVGEFFYDIQMVTTTPSVRTVLWGSFDIIQDISKLAP